MFVCVCEVYFTDLQSVLLLHVFFGSYGKPVMSNDSCCTNIDESKIDGALCANFSHYVYVQLG